MPQASVCTSVWPTPDGVRYFSEVVAESAGGEEVLHATGLKASPVAAVEAARDWMRRNDVREEES